MHHVSLPRQHLSRASFPRNPNGCPLPPHRLEKATGTSSNLALPTFHCPSLVFHSERRQQNSWLPGLFVKKRHGGLQHGSLATRRGFRTPRRVSRSPRPVLGAGGGDRCARRRPREGIAESQRCARAPNPEPAEGRVSGPPARGASPHSAPARSTVPVAHARTRRAPFPRIGPGPAGFFSLKRVRATQQA